MALGLPVATNIQAGFSNVNAPDIVSIFNRAVNTVSIIAPRGVQQIDSFAFDYKADDVVDLTADITDHWLEDNTAVQDSIGIRPVIVTLSGFISELSMASDLFTQFSGIAAGVENALSTADAYLGKYTPGVTNNILTSLTQAQNVIVQAEQALARGNQILGLLGSTPKANKQQTAFITLSSLWASRAIFTVYTPFRVYNNMAIQNIRAVQSKQTRSMSDFVVTMKQLTFTKNFLDYPAQFGGRASTDYQSQSAGGGTAGTAAPLADMTSMFNTAEGF